MSEDAREASDSTPLREARMARGISLEQVTRDIHISKSFLEALEAGDYTDFPGDAYVTGFIRSYASYLELDPEPLVDRYRMQQAASGAADDVPPGRRRSPLVAVLVLALLLFAAGVAALVRWVIPPAAVADRNVGQQADAPATPFVMTGDVVIQVLAIGTVLQVPIGDRRYEVLLARYDNGLVIRYGGNEVLLAVGGERLLDLDGDSQTDLRMLLNGVDRTSEPMRVNLTLQRGTGSDQAAAPVRSGRA
jgi:transcriptional regulator with XRE-family HTH domain